jgi:hypothetical protein
MGMLGRELPVEFREEGKYTLVIPSFHDIALSTVKTK